MKAFVLVTVDCGGVEGTTVVGDSDIGVIVVDFDYLETDPEAASETAKRIMDQYGPDEAPETAVAIVVERLNEIAADDYEGGLFGEVFDDEDGELVFEDEEDLVTYDEMGGTTTQSVSPTPDYNANELIGGEPTRLDPRD